MTRRDFGKPAFSLRKKTLRENTCAIASGDYSTPVSQRLQKKASQLNNPSLPVQSERFFASLSLNMGDKEKKAWQRRNDAAHGNATKPDGSIELMRDIQLLKNTFHRIIISMTGASSQYIDCYSPKFPIRQIGEAVEARDRLFFEG